MTCACGADDDAGGVHSGRWSENYVLRWPPTFTAIVSEAVHQEVVSQKLLKEAEQLVNNGWGMFGEFFNERFEGISILGSGFSLKPADRRRYLQKIRRSNRLDELESMLGKIAHSKRILLVVDNPEEIVGAGLDDVSDDNAVRIGALLSVLSRAHSHGVRVVCFVKEHIAQAVRSHYPDFQHFADQIESLAWTEADLIKMLEARVRTRLNLNCGQVFATKKESFAKVVLPYLSNGPRDLLFLCNAAGTRGEPISTDQVLNSVRALRTDRLKDLASQYKQWRKFDQFAGAMISELQSQYSDNSIPIGGINAVFADLYSTPGSAIHSMRGIDWVDRARWEAPPVDERLFVAGIVGFVERGAKVYPWAGRYVARFQGADAHFLSPLFSETSEPKK